MRNVIAGLCIVAVVALAGLLATALLGRQQAEAIATRIAAGQARQLALTELDADLHDYSQQVAARLFFGRTQRDELVAARVALERTFAHLDQATRDEITALGGMGEVGAQLPKVDAVRRMLELYHSIDLVATQALAARRDGKPSDIDQIYATQVQFRLVNEVQPVLDAEQTNESADIAAQQQSLAALQDRIISAQVVIAVLGAVLLGGGCWWLIRRIGRDREAVATRLTGGPAKAARLTEFAALATAAQPGLDATATLRARAAALEDTNAGLEAMDEQRVQMLADIGHQLRTPITILRGEADVALRGAADDLREALERVQGQAAELGQLIDDLMAYARSDIESREHVPVACQLADIVQAAASESRTLAEPREVTIEVERGDAAAKVEADPRRLRQALLIGLDNAIKHTPPGETVRLVADRADGWPRMRIFDSGPGIEPGELPHVFERFFRGQGEAAMFNPGIGIGLAIARRIVERHGGRIAIENRPEGGAMLTILLPPAQGAA